MNDAMHKLFGSAARVIEDTFSCMEIAEEVIAAAKQAQPDHEEVIHETFRYLCPTEALRGKAVDLCRAHCQEIIQRVIDRERLEPATNPEMCGALSDLSLIAPLNSTASYLYHRCFKRVFPGKTIAVDGYEPQESHPGAAEELARELRRRLSTSRVKPEPACEIADQLELFVA